VRIIKAKGGLVYTNEGEAQFVGENLALVGGMRLFHRFMKKLGIEEAVGQNIDLINWFKTGKIVAAQCIGP
jgi:hypothetical protein